MRLILSLVIFSALPACRTREPAQIISVPAVNTTVIAVAEDTSQLESLFIEHGLVDIQSFIPGVIVDLRYSGNNNFIGHDLYGGLNKAYIQPDVAEMLVKAHRHLKETDSTLTFIIYDAARPVSVQQILWDSVRSKNNPNGRYVSNPKLGSLHNYGAALDLSICTLDTVLFDMGTDYDYFGELAQPQKENWFLHTGELTQMQYDNRKLLRKAMLSAGFRQLPSEWWHYNACSRESAWIKYKLIE